MSILRSLYWNYQSKIYNLSKGLLHNLYNKQCESSNILFLYCNFEIHEYTKMDEDCYIIDDDCYIVSDNIDLIKNNKTNVSTSTTAFEAGTSSSGPNNSCCGSSVPNVRRWVPRNKESTSNTTTNRININPNSVLNPLNITQFVNSRYQSCNLSLCNLPSLYYEQQSNYSAPGFRNESLFSEQKDSSNSAPQLNDQNSSWKGVKDEDIAKDLRKWTPLPVDKVYLESTPGIQFILMSYNVLAQDLLVEHQYLYRRNKPRALLWETRWINLYQEIADHDPDILCLQEVQETHLEKYFSQLLDKGYAHIYKKKTGHRSDGCAIYYKQNKLKLLENTTVEYNQHFPTLDRDNVAIIAKFAPVNHSEPKKHFTEFVVATTHLLYNPKREDVRLAQTQLLLSEIDRFAYKGENKEEKYAPIIITGDFNTEPNSAVYRLLRDGNLKYDMLSNRTLKETNSTEKIQGKFLIPSILRVTDKCQHLDLLQYRSKGEKLTRTQELKLIHIRHSKRDKPVEKDPENDSLFSTGTLSHDLNLQSAFLHRTQNDTEATTYQDKWITVDYIFYSGSFDKDLQNIKFNKLKLLSRYSVPTSSELSSKVHHIPNFAFGSDHLSLLAKFFLEY